MRSNLQSAEPQNFFSQCLQITILQADNWTAQCRAEATFQFPTVFTNGLHSTAQRGIEGPFSLTKQSDERRLGVAGGTCFLGPHPNNRGQLVLAAVTAKTPGDTSSREARAAVCRLPKTKKEDHLPFTVGDFILVCRTRRFAFHLDDAMTSTVVTLFSTKRPSPRLAIARCSVGKLRKRRYR